MPEILIKKILLHYMIDYLETNNKQKAANILNLIKYKDFSLTCLYFNKFGVNGYIQFIPPDLYYLKQKCPYIKFNSLANTNYMRTMLNSVWKRVKFHYNKLRILPGPMEQHNIFIAGGFFTNYKSNNKFIDEFRNFYQYFLENKDIDIYYTNNRSQHFQYNNHYQIKEYLFKFNLVVYRNNFENVILNSFDFDCC